MKTTVMLLVLTTLALAQTNPPYSSGPVLSTYPGRNPHLQKFVSSYSPVSNAGINNPGITEAQWNAYWSAWIPKHFDWFNGGFYSTAYATDLTPYLGNVGWAGYIDGNGLYNYETYNDSVGVAATNGWTEESMWTHLAHDQHVDRAPWVNMDQFDNWDRSLPTSPNSLGGPARGAYMFNGTTYADETVNLYDGTCPPATCTVTATNTLYLGYQKPFAIVNVYLSQVRVGGSVSWQYWNGSIWVSVPALTDTTSGLTKNGQFYFRPPTNWAKSSINGGWSKYWIRVSVTGATTSPIFAVVRGDDLYVPGAFMQDSAGTYYPLTNALINGNCPAIMCTLSSGNNFLVGYDTTFTSLTINYSTAAVGGTVIWQYWIGAAWASLAVIDPSNGLTAAAGTSYTLTFNAPPNWAASSINGSPSKFWIRAIIVSPTVAPVMHTVSSSNTTSVNVRGWCATCAHLNTAGSELEFSYVIPAGQTAQLRWQGRFSIGPNQFFYNFTDQQGSPPTLTALGALKSRWSSVPIPKNNTFLDNGYGQQSPLLNDSDLSCAPSCYPVNTTAYLPARQAFVYAVTQAARTWPSVVQPYRGLIVNAGFQFKLYADINGYEGEMLIPNGFAFTFTDGAGGGFDAYTPTNNPRNTLVSMEATDDLYFQWTRTVGGNTLVLPWDKSNRSPMWALAAFYLGASPNMTGFYWHTQGINAYAAYSDADEFYYWSTTNTSYWTPVTSTLSAPVALDTSTTTTKTINVVDGSGFTVVGAPARLPWTNYILQFGTNDYSRSGLDNTDTVEAVKVSNTQWTTTTPITHNWPAGTQVRFARAGHYSLPNQNPPPMADIWYYANYFPAEEVDIGVPDPAGMNGGARLNPWITAAANSNYSPVTNCGVSVACAAISRRDYTNAIVLVSATNTELYLSNITNSEWITPGKPITLGGTYYELHADGTTGPPITTIALRAGDAAILMKAPVGPPPTGPTAATWSVGSIGPGLGRAAPQAAPRKKAPAKKPGSPPSP